MSSISSRLPEIVSTLKVLKNVVALAPLGEHVAAGIDLAISICEMAEKAKTNRAAYEELGLRIAALLAGISNVVQKAPEDRLTSVLGNIEDVIQVLTSARDIVRSQTSKSTKSSKSFFKSFKGIRVERDNEEMAALDVKISAALERFQVESHIRLELITQHVAEMLNEQKTRLAAIQETLSRDAEMARLEKITHISSARYDSDELQDQVMPCLEGTRMTLLADLDAWATSSDGAPFFWLNGLAGTGKSTVACTFCQRISQWKDTPMVLASFFVSRHSTDRRKAVNILHTLVYQLALQDPAIRSSVSQALAEEPDLITRSLSQQVAKLFGNSICATERSHPIILVLDALDECEADSQGREGGQLLTLLARSCSESKRSVKLLVTSRLEPTIREMFDEIQASTSRSEVVQLHDIDRVVVREDIHRYLVHSFNEIAHRVKAANWPSEVQVNALLDNADVLFIYAATVVRYIGHRQFDPRKRLEQVLMRTGKSAQSAYRQLDGLYESVLTNAISGAALDADDEPEIAERLQMMLGTVVLVLQRLSPSTIAGLLNWSAHETELALARLTAVFIIHEDEPVRIFHPSFPDFLLDSSRCTDPRLHVGAHTYHAILARQCLSAMNSLLHKDVLETGLNPLIRNWHLDGVNARIERFMPSHLQYAVCYWMNHVVESALDIEGLHQALETFCKTHLLHWLECLSYLQKLDVAVSGLPTVIGHLVDSAPSQELIYNVHHMLREYYLSIRDSAAHVYHSALVTMPSCRLYELSFHEKPDNVTLRTPRRAAFNTDIMHMQIGCTNPEAFALSSDGMHIACYEHGAVYIGNTGSGEMTLLDPPIDRISGSTDRIIALQFSLDCRYLLCADDQGIVYSTEWPNGFWTARSPVEPIDEDITGSTATFSSSGSHCVFTLRDNRQHLSCTPEQRSKCLLVLRRAESGAALQSLHERDDDTHEPSNSQFTPDAQHVFQAYGNSIFVWDVPRQTLHTKILAMNEDAGWSMSIQRLTAVSNTVCASLSFGGTIALWDLIQGVHLRTITQGSVERSQHVFGLTCSSDGSLLGVICENIVKVVNVADSHIIAEHTLPPARKMWTQNAGLGMDASRSRLVMAGTGHPISIWNYSLENHIRRNSSPTYSQGYVSCTGFSADGSLLVSGTEDGSMTIWTTESGLPIVRYSGEGVMAAVSLSGPCSKFIFSSRNLGVDPALDRWERSSVFQLSDRTTGDILLSREHRPNPEVHAATLSPDDMYLALWLAHSKGFLEVPITSTFVLDTRTGKTVASSESSGTNEQLASDPEGQAYTPDGLNLVQTCFGSITVRDALNLKIRYTLSYNENPSQAGFTIVSPCSTRVGRISPINGYRLRLRVWGLQSGLILMETHLGEEFERNSRWWGHLKPVWTQSQLLYASRNGISIWDFDESEPPTVHLWDPALKPKYMCSSPDGSFIYAWCEDEHIRVWATTDGFILPRPILKLTASPWPEEVKRALSSPGPLIIFHDENVLQVLAPTEPGRRYLCVVVDLSDGSCVRVTPFGDGQEWERPSLLKVTANNRLHMLSPADTIVPLVSRLAHVSFHENDAHVAEADWVVMVNDTFEKLERALLQVWNLEIGEMEATVVWSGTTVEIEEIPHTFVLRRSHPADTLDEGLIYAHYSSHDAWLRVYTGSLSAELFWRLGIPSDMRPSFPTSSETNISTYGSRVAMGSANGTVNIFDFAKALHAVEVRKGTGREPIEAAVKGWQW